MAGPAYQFDAEGDAGVPRPTAWPAYYDNVPLFYEWTRDYIKEFRLDADREAVADINDVLGSFDLQNPIDIEFGAERLAVRPQLRQRVLRAEPAGRRARAHRLHRPGRQPCPDGDGVGRPDERPRPAHGALHLPDVDDPDGQRVRYEWDFDADGKVDSRVREPDLHLHGERGCSAPR